MRPSLRVALLALCVALLAMATWRWVRTDGKPAAAAMAGLDEPAEATPSKPEDIARPLPPQPALPSAAGTDAPLPPDIAALLARADAGDARAACTLGTRLVACAYADFYTAERLDLLRQEEARWEAQGDIARANEIASMLLQGTAIFNHCDPIPADLRARAADYLRQAALAGEPEALVRYASGDALVRRATQQHAFLREPTFDHWRTEALPLLDSLQQSGRPEAVLVRLVGTLDGSHLSLVTPPDSVQDEAYRLLAGRLFGEHDALRRFEAPPDLTAEQRQLAAQQAGDWHRTQFSGRRFRLEEHVAGLVPPLATQMDFGWPQPANTAPSCFDDSAGSGR